MNLRCSLGLHNWSSDCEKCSRCGKTRENYHNWTKNCDICSGCGKKNYGNHDYGPWKMKSAGTYYSGKHRVSEIGLRICTKCGIEDICKDHNFTLVKCTGSIYDSVEYYRCQNCGSEFTISYNI